MRDIPTPIYKQSDFTESGCFGRFLALYSRTRIGVRAGISGINPTPLQGSDLMVSHQ